MKIRLLAALVVVGVAAFVAAGSAGAAADSTCPGGTLSPGIYNNVNVTGTCIATGDIWIKGNLNVNGNSVFDAEHGGTINGNVQAWNGSVLDLQGFSITHGVSASGATSVELVLDNLGQGVLIQGGGGAPTGACNRHDVPITGVPEARVDSNEVLGNVTIAGRGGCGNAIFSNSVSGNVNFVNNMAGSRSEQFVQSNVISGNLFCKNNNPHPILGGNIVGGTINFPGDCAVI